MQRVRPLPAARRAHAPAQAAAGAGDGAAGAAPAAAAKPNTPASYPPPPSIIHDRKQGAAYTLSHFLGEGGFARCYLVYDAAGARLAAKVVHKQSLKNAKQKQKLLAEIKIHQTLAHRHVVQFVHVFEDSDNVYILLELCENKTFVDMLKKRKRLTEPEIRFYAKQLGSALLYLHSNRIIHRDLKLGNLFLDEAMNIKVGDFGLAATIRKDGERKKTICGTPNYIAPEVLFDSRNGHSYEVDVWSFGVILYTLVVGKPPFQTKDIKAIYKNIKENRYDFPPDVTVSPELHDLITSILTTQPDARPGVRDILAHPFLTDPRVPAHMPKAALYGVPDLDHAAAAASSSTLRLNRNGLFQEGDVNVLAAAGTSPRSASKSPPKPSSARKENKVPDSAAVEDGLRRMDLAGAEVSGGAPADAKDDRVFRSTVGVSAAKFAQQQQKAAKPASVPTSPVTRRRDGSSNVIAQAAVQSPSRAAVRSPAVAQSPAAAAPPAQPAATGGLIEQTYGNIRAALDDPSWGVSTSSVTLPAPRVFISKWIDYSNKYGLGYQLTNGAVGVYFNDLTTMVMSPDEQNFEYLYQERQQQPPAGEARQSPRTAQKPRMFRHHYSTAAGAYPDTISKKVVLLNHFRTYMKDNLYKAPNYNYVDAGKHRDIEFLNKYLRTKHAILFRLSHGVVQVNFFDHTKLVLADMGRNVTFIDAARRVETRGVCEWVRGDGEVRRRLAYARDILEQMASRRR